MIEREKDAGFIYYFCPECIEKLYAEYNIRMRNN